MTTQMLSDFFESVGFSGYEAREFVAAYEGHLARTGRPLPLADAHQRFLAGSL